MILLKLGFSEAGELSGYAPVASAERTDIQPSAHVPKVDRSPFATWE